MTSLQKIKNKNNIHLHDACTRPMFIISSVKISKSDTKICCAFDSCDENFDLQYVAFNGARLMSLQEERRLVTFGTIRGD